MILGMEQTDTPHAGHGQANIPKEKKLVSGLDGQSRSARHEDDLNKLLMRVFRGPDGEAAFTAEDFEPKRNEVMPEWAFKKYDALCEKCYLESLD